MQSSKSSPIESLAKPPTSITASLRKIPNAPEMISSELTMLQPVRAAVNARRYSTVWNIGSHWLRQPDLGARARPRVTSQPVGDADDPARRDRPVGALDERPHHRHQRPSGSSSESASTQQTSG